MDCFYIMRIGDQRFLIIALGGIEIALLMTAERGLQVLSTVSDMSDLREWRFFAVVLGDFIGDRARQHRDIGILVVCDIADPARDIAALVTVMSRHTLQGFHGGTTHLHIRIEQHFAYDRQHGDIADRRQLIERGSADIGILLAHGALGSVGDTLLGFHFVRRRHVDALGQCGPVDRERGGSDIPGGCPIAGGKGENELLHVFACRRYTNRRWDDVTGIAPSYSTSGRENGSRAGGALPADA